MNAMNAMDATSMHAPLRGHFVMLRADALRLLLPQQDVETAGHLSHQLREAPQPGLFLHGDDPQPVVVPSGTLRPMPVPPPDRFVLTRMTGSQGPLTFAWSEVRVLIDATLQRNPLPPALRAPGMPCTDWLELDGELALYTTARQLVDYIRSQEG